MGSVLEATEYDVLPWSVATLKDDVHVVGVQGEVTDEFTERVTEIQGESPVL
jgi:hypothetical protein